MDDRAAINAQLLQQIAAAIEADPACPLRDSRRCPVPGEGSPTARIAFVGEAPGADEDSCGRPFVGRSGRLLRATIAELGIPEQDFWIGNILKCRPPDNRDPLPAEVEHCQHYLFAQLALIQPRVIVTLGRFALHCLIDPGLQITKVRGRPVRKLGQLFLPTLHPSAVLRSPNTRLADFRRDIAAAVKLAAQP